MSRNIFNFILTSLLFPIIFATSAKAQTCRINAGVCNGKSAYIEVYEYDFVDKKPEFPGGDEKFVKFLNEHRRYPAAAYSRGVEGRVICSFVVNSDGSISHATVLKGVEPSLNSEALRLIQNMPNWKSGRINGQTVPVRVIRAVPFRK